MNDLVNHPPHYQSRSGFECIEIIEAFELDFHLGNAVKYILRAGRKVGSPSQVDLEKAIWYLKRKIELDNDRTDSK
jgi:hypothetical protein